MASRSSETRQDLPRDEEAPAVYGSSGQQKQRLEWRQPGPHELFLNGCSPSL